MKLKPFKAWLLWDAEDTYAPSLHNSRRDAKAERDHHSYLRDARWRIARVSVRPVDIRQQGD